MKTIKHTNILRFKELKDNKSFKTYDFVCRGCTMRGRSRIWEGYVSSMSDWTNMEIDNSYMTLEEEPDNAYDPNAIMIVCRGEFFGTMGYVGKEYTSKIKNILSDCLSYRLDMINDSEINFREVNLRITWITQKSED